MCYVGIPMKMYTSNIGNKKYIKMFNDNCQNNFTKNKEILLLNPSI